MAAAGTDLSDVKAQLKAQLAVVGYSFKEVKVSALIAQLTGVQPSSDEAERMKCLMDAGDRCRELSKQGDGVAATVIAEIRRLRSLSKGSDSQSMAYVIDSFKNPAEIELFDRVYSRNYYTVSVYLEKRIRVENLQLKIARSRREPPGEDHLRDAKSLVNLDEKSIGKRSQNVRDTFARADFFVDAKTEISGQLTRFIALVFNRPFISPTPDEYGMFVAKASGLRSVDLSRQVGAAVFDVRKRVISTGCNEVPYPGGGIFGFPHKAIGDNRDHTQQVDPNFVEIQRSLIELVEILQEANLVGTDEGDAPSLVDSLLAGKFKDLMSSARVRNLVEFGRVVHAEMHEICEAAATGKATEGGTLYTTAFPCHGCARHVIAAGIAEVIYIEPYPKSLAVQLYKDEIVFQHEGDELKPRPDKRVVFRPFRGIAPVLYQRVFSHRGGKDDRGTIAAWSPLEAIPVGAVHSVERPTLELAASNSVANILEQVRKVNEAAKES